MAKLYFRYGAMGSSKTANAIMVDYNYRERGQRSLILKPKLDTRDGARIIRSRSGLQASCLFFEELPSIDPRDYDCIIVDEAQFLNKAQVQQLVDIVDEMDVPVICYGLRADFQQNLFEGSKWLLAWADSIEEIKTVCWCGRKATCNARISGGKVIKDGEQILLGGSEAYVALCRKHWAQGRLMPVDIRKIDHGKEDFWDMLLLADPCREMVERYLYTGELYALYSGGKAVCECVMHERDDGAIELKNLATLPQAQRQGHATALLQEMFRIYGARYGKMYVGTCGAENFYTSLGFHYAYCEKDFFTRNYPEPVIDNGVQCIDIHYFVRDLRP